MDWRTLLIVTSNNFVAVQTGSFFGFAEYVCSRLVFALASLWLIVSFVKLEFSRSNQCDVKTHQRLSMMGAVALSMATTQSDNNSMCSLACITLQYLFTVFMTLMVLELAQIVSVTDKLSRNRNLVIFLGWSIPIIPVFVAGILFQRLEALCWLNLGPELAFSTMLPAIVTSSVAVLFAETTQPQRRGYFYVITNAWLLYFTIITSISYQQNIIYSLCYFASCYGLVHSMKFTAQSSLIPGDVEENKILLL